MIIITTKKILQSIRIKEYLLILFSFVLIVSYALLVEPRSDHLNFFKNGLESIASGAQYFMFVLVFFGFYIFYKIYLILGVWGCSLFEKKFSFGKRCFSFSIILGGFWGAVKNFILNFLIILRPFLSVTVFFIFINLLLGLMAFQLKGHLIDGRLAELDKSIFGFYPFFELSNQDIFLGKISVLFVYSYLGLALVMSIAWVVFYLIQRKKVFYQYIIALILATTISIPLWFLFPANTPLDAYVNNIYGNNMSAPLIEAVGSYNPNQIVWETHKSLGAKQEGAAGVSTMPSMHIAWAVIILYYFFRVQKRTIFLTLPWFFFSSFGTFYLAQHYFVDVLPALPIAFISIAMANVLVGMEKKYYQPNGFDRREEALKAKIRGDLAKIIQAPKLIYRDIRSAIG